VTARPANGAIEPSTSEAQARMHTILRFAAGATSAFIFCEFMGWYPTFLAPLLAGMLLANLPTALPFKLGVVLIVIQAAGAYAAYSLSSLLLQTPLVLFGTIAWLTNPNDEKAKPKVDLNNADASKRSRPIMGSAIILPMKADGADKWSGQVYNAEDGKTYGGSFSLSGANKADLKGCVAIICKTKTWTRTN